MEIEKVIIIGSGPAGLSAAIYASRGDLDPLVITGRAPGGQLMLTTDVDDFPGFETGIQGPELMDKMRKQAAKFKTGFLEEDVVSVDLSVRPFVIKTENRNLSAEALIIATGASAMWLGLPSEQKLIGKGVSACAACDGFFFKEKEILVIGGGDSAMREAQHLSKFGKNVTIVHRRDAFRAQPALIALVKSKPNVKFLFNKVVKEILGEDKAGGVKLTDVITGQESEMLADGVFLAIGHKPNTDFLKGQIELDEKGYIIPKGDTQTSVEGVFFAGDVADKKYKQAATAAGMGVKAALDCEEYLEHLKLPTEGNGD